MLQSQHQIVAVSKSRDVPSECPPAWYKNSGASLFRMVRVELVRQSWPTGSCSKCIGQEWLCDGPANVRVCLACFQQTNLGLRCLLPLKPACRCRGIRLVRGSGDSLRRIIRAGNSCHSGLSPAEQGVHHPSTDHRYAGYSCIMGLEQPGSSDLQPALHFACRQVLLSAVGSCWYQQVSA